MVNLFVCSVRAADLVFVLLSKLLKTIPQVR